ncbi:nucleoside-binding protein [Dasania marina]|uniref:nucleoside-binding protein n=1 Tax=Dasania marina TaxID=471499 RepID=UPI0030DA48C3|tara:strand:+ start:23938 stop:24774 length:837 start_codon:yes stop_codon:yes gene_type:complete
MRIINKFTMAAVLGSIVSMPALAETWSSTEVHFQSGNLEQVGTGGATVDTTIITLQHAGGWEYGDNFFFVDHITFDSDGKGDNPFNAGSDGSEFYGEWYSNFSLGAITGNEIKFGPVKDIGVIAGLNFAPEVDSYWLLPGVRFALDLPGFAFANLDVTAYLQDSTGDKNASHFTILDEDDSWMVDFNWAYPFKIGSTSWSFEGHVEYIDGRDQVTNFGSGELEYWILAQPQLRFDIGEAMGGKAGRIFIGIEYQYWKNKLGEKGTNDNEAQLLAVWHF